MHCLGLRSTQSSQILESITCNCKHRLASTAQRRAFARNFRRRIQNKMNARRRSPEVKLDQLQKQDAEEVQKENPCAHAQTILVACILAAAVTAHEQSAIKPGCYVRLHGLNKQVYNGQEGMVTKCEQTKAEVKLANYKKGEKNLIKVHRKNLTVLPTYTISRCKLMQHRIIEVTFHPEPVMSWPMSLTGTYFEYLGLDRTATTDEIKTAYRNLSVLLHPDKNPTYVEKATTLFKQIREAYEVLKDEQERTHYLNRLRMEDLFRRHATGNKNQKHRYQQG